MGEGDHLSHLLETFGVVQVAIAAAIGAAETKLWQQSLPDGLCNFAFQVNFSPGDDRLHEAAMWQKIVYVPSSCLFDSLGYQDVTIHSLEAARTSCRACVRIIAP